jgi:hypothetical protein
LLWYKYTYRKTKENSKMKIHIDLPDETHKKLKANCALTGISMTKLIGDLINRYFKEDKRELE